MSTPHRFSIIMLGTIVVALVSTGTASAYIGPGSGMEFVGQFMALLAMVGVAFLSILMWPFYAFMRWARGPKKPTGADAPAITPTADAATPPAPPAPTPASGPGTPPASS